MKMYFCFRYPKHKTYYVRIMDSSIGVCVGEGGGGAREAAKRITIHCGKD